MKIVDGKQIDRSILLSLRVELWPHHSKEDLDAEITEILCSDKMFVYVGFEDQEPVGFIELSIRDRAPGSERKPIPYIEGWCVCTKYRGEGYGRELITYAEKWARQLGYDKLASDTTTNYPGSLESHKAIGFKVTKTTYHFIKSI